MCIAVNVTKREKHTPILLVPVKEVLPTRETATQYSISLIPDSLCASVATVVGKWASAVHSRACA